MSIRFGGVVIDVTDLDRLARFWSSLLDLQPTRREADWIGLGPQLALQRVPEPKTAKYRVHLDLVTSDLTEATARAVALGASPVSGIREDLWQVWQDPRGQRILPLQIVNKPDPGD